MSQFLHTDGPIPEETESSANQAYANIVPTLGERFDAEAGTTTAQAWHWLKRTSFPTGHGDYIDPDEANKRYAPEDQDGKPTKLFDQRIQATDAESIGRAKANEIEREGILSRYGGAHSWVTNLGVGAVGFMLDPIQAGTAFLPGIGEEAIMARLGTDFLSKTVARGTAGALSGGGAMVPVAAMKYGIGQTEASDYDLRSAFADIAGGAMFAAVMHAGIMPPLKYGWQEGRLRLAEQGIFAPEAEPIPVTPDDLRAMVQLGQDRSWLQHLNSIYGAEDMLSADAATRRTAMQSALSQVIDGRPVDLSAIFPDHGEAARNIDPQAFQEFDSLAAEQRRHEQMLAPRETTGPEDIGAEAGRVLPGGVGLEFPERMTPEERDLLSMGKPSEDSMFALNGFYSPALRAAEAINQEKGTGEQFWKQITKIPGVKKDELDWMGLEEFLKDKPSITKAEVLDFMRAHQIQLDEKALGGDTVYKHTSREVGADELSKIAEFDKENLKSARQIKIVDGPDFATAYIVQFKGTPDKFHILDRRGTLHSEATSESAAEHQAIGLATEGHANKTTAKFAGHKVHGGENYRELLIRLPELGETKTRDLTPEESADLAGLRTRLAETKSRLDKVRASGGSTFDLRDEADFVSRQIREIEQGSITQRPYTSKHFNDQELVHLRVDDRTGPNGEKVLFVNEVQSDLHQVARRFGYGPEGYAKAKAAAYRLYDDEIIKEAIDHIAKAEKSSSADVIENYGFRNPGDYVTLAAQKYEFEGRPDTESKVKIAAQKYIDAFGEKGAPNAPLKEDLWLELALKRALLYASENGYDAVSWARSDQIAKAVGAEPKDLALQYNSKIGKFLDKYTKKWGGKVEEADIGTPGPELSQLARAALRVNDGDKVKAIAYLENLKSPDAGKADQLAAVAELKAAPESPLLRITPEMRASVMEGQPYSLGAHGKPLASFRSSDLLIKIAMDAENKLGLVSHEAMHALRHLNVFTPEEWGTLESAARTQGWIESQQVRERYAEVYKGRANLENLLTEEAIAEQYAQWRTRAKQFAPEVQTLFQKIADFFERIKEWFKGNGFQTADDASLEKLHAQRPDAFSSDEKFALSQTSKQDWESNLQTFIGSSYHNEWINGDGFKAYVRQAERLVPGTLEAVSTLDIASIEVNRALRGQGVFRDVLESAKNVALKNGIKAIYVESVLTDKFANFFRRAGWLEEKPHFAGAPPSFMLRLDEGQNAFAQTLKDLNAYLSRGGDIKFAMDTDPVHLPPQDAAVTKIFRSIASGEMKERFEAPIRARKAEVESRMAELEPRLRAAYARAKDARTLDLGKIADEQRALYRDGFAQGMPQEELKRTMEEVYGSANPGVTAAAAATETGTKAGKPAGGEAAGGKAGTIAGLKTEPQKFEESLAEAKNPATARTEADRAAEDEASAAIPPELAAEESRLQQMIAEGYKLEAEEAKELAESQVALQAADLKQQAYSQAAECLIEAGL